MSKRVKKDFDKEKMYRKIMPSALMKNADVPIEKTVEPTLSAPAIPEPAAPLEAEEKEAVLHNFMEDMVQEKLEHTMTVLESCDCPRCRKDISALALNQLPPAYAVAQGDPAKYIKKLKGNYEVKVTASLIKAIQIVKKNPRH